MAIMFMKIDTNCDGTVDWVSSLDNMILWCVMFVMKLTASGIKVLSQERSESTTKLKHYKLHSIHCKHGVTMVSLCDYCVTQCDHDITV